MNLIGLVSSGVLLIRSWLPASDGPNMLIQIYPSIIFINFLLHASTLLPQSFANTCRLPLLEQGQI